MSEYIDRETLENDLNYRLNFLMAESGEYDRYTNGFEECVCRVENFCSADVAPVVHARWKPSPLYPHVNAWCCSACNEEWYFTSETLDADYCPSCGAKMDGKEQDDE